jgi:hypothetical protein
MSQAMLTEPPVAEASADATPPGARSGRRPYLVAIGIYLLTSIVLWWHVLPHLSTVTTCGCGDAALTLWVIKWPAYALSHGLNPFYSSKLLAPVGINMAPNSLGLGIVFAPVTWLFGPTASLNLIDLVSPPLSALSMFWMLRRWVPWSPAAFAGGLFFGFSPFVLVSLAFAHPNFGLLAPIPLIIGCLDELFVRRRRNRLWVGAGLGLLVTAEFFISVEVLLLLVLFSVFAAVLVGVWALATRPARIVPSVRHAAPGVLVGGGVAAVLLVYPLWFFFAGPAHLVGRAWPDSPAGTVANTPGDFVGGFVATPLTGILHAFGGYQGPRLPLFGYLGIGMLIVLLVGVILCRRDRRVWLFGLLGVIAAVLSLGVGNGYWGPWRIFIHLSVLNNVVPVNINAIVDTCVAVLLAVIISRVRAGALDRWGRRGAAITGAAVAAVALVPIGVAFWPNVPMTVRPVITPRWFTVVAPHLGPGRVVLPYPASLNGIQSSMAWQAQAGMTFAMVGGGGPGVTPSRAGRERPGFNVLAQASLPLGRAPTATAANLAAIRSALRGWGVTTVVVPDQPTTPTYERGRSVPYAVALFTAALGAVPVFEADAWVWDKVERAGASTPMTPAAFADCADRGGVDASGSSAAAECVRRDG